MSVIIHELDLGNKINCAIHQQHRAEFGLLLSMLTDQAQEFAEFKIARDEINQPDKTEARLKKELGVHPSVRLSAEGDYFFAVKKLGEALHQSGQQSMLMTKYIINDALSQYNDKTKIDEHVLDNCSLHTRRRIDNSELETIESDITKMKEVVEQARSYVA